MIKSAYKKGNLQFEWVHKRIDGNEIYIDVSLSVIPAKIKKLLLVCWRDITETKKAEETIRKLFQAISQTNEIVFMTAVDGTINYVNKAFEDVYGYNRDEIMGKVTPRILKSGLTGKKFYKELWKKMPSGNGVRQEVTNKTKDGRLITIDSSMSPIFNDSKKLIGYMAVQEDITEKKVAQKKLLDAELQYRTLYEQSPDGICLVDPKSLLILDCNEKAHMQLGYSFREFMQLRIFDFEISDKPKEIKERAKKIVLKGHDDFKTRHRSKNGEVHEVHATVQKVVLHGKPVFYAIFRDITETVKLEEKLKQQEINRQREIMQATIMGQEKEKNELGRELHDNVNQLLATAKIYLGMLKAKQDNRMNEDLAGKSYEYVNIAIDEIRKLTHALVTPQLGKKNLYENLREFVQEVNSTSKVKVKLTNQIKNIRICDPQKELMVYRIVQEQMSNIYKHANAKRVEIRLKQKKENLLVSISDDGKGFEPKNTSHGIGFRNIQSRLEFYSGTLSIKSSPDQGCMLEVMVPLKIAKIHRIK